MKKKPRRRNPLQRIRPVLRSAEKKFKVKWDVRYLIDPDGQTCRITSNPEIKRHNIIILPSVINDIHGKMHNVAHELCHAWLAENVDVCFSQLAFAEECNQLDREKFVGQARLLYLAYIHLDIWVNELRHQVWPDLTGKEHREFAQSMRQIIISDRKETLEQPEIIIATAVHIAERNRMDMPPDSVSEDIKCLSNNARLLINNLTDYYIKLPSLKYRQEEDLKTLEKSVKEVAEILGLDFKPRLHFNDNRRVWIF